MSFLNEPELVKSEYLIKLKKKKEKKNDFFSLYQFAQFFKFHKYFKLNTWLIKLKIL